MTGKPDPANQPIVHKLRGGGVIAWTTEIDKFLGRNRHDNVMQACYKVRHEFKDIDPDFFAAHFIEGEYTAKNGQRYSQYGVYRAGFVAMMKHVHNLADKTVLYLAAYDRKAEVAEKRKGPPEPEPADQRIVLDLTKEPGGPEDHARLILSFTGMEETPERVAEIAHHLPPAPEEDLPPAGEPLVHVDGMRVYATTLDIAAFFQRRHKDVLANVREIELLQPEFFGPNFRPVTYTVAMGRNARPSR